MTDHLYETSVMNTDGVDGTAYVDRPDGLRVVTSSPLNDLPGTNPEELFGLAITTCLNETIKTLLKAHRIEAKSQVSSKIKFVREPNEPGYYFDVEVFAAIEDIEFSKAEKIIKSAEKRCPVSKLVQGSKTVQVHAVAYEKP